MPRHRLCIFILIPGLSFLAGQSAAAPTIPLPEPGSEPGLLPALVILGMFTTVAAAELVRPIRTRSGATSRRWIGNLSLCILSNGVVVLPTMTAFVASLFSQSEQKGLLDALGLPSTMRLVVAIIGLDALAYALHRLLHRVDALWRFHAVHHSDPEVDVTTTFRHHPVEAIFNGALIGGVVLLIGFSPERSRPILGFRLRLSSSHTQILRCHHGSAQSSAGLSSRPSSTIFIIRGRMLRRMPILAKPFQSGIGYSEPRKLDPRKTLADWNSASRSFAGRNLIFRITCLRNPCCKELRSRREPLLHVRDRARVEARNAPRLGLTPRESKPLPARGGALQTKSSR